MVWAGGRSSSEAAKLPDEAVNEPESDSVELTIRVDEADERPHVGDAVRDDDENASLLELLQDGDGPFESASSVSSAPEATNTVSIDEPMVAEELPNLDRVAVLDESPQVHVGRVRRHRQGEDSSGGGPARASEHTTDTATAKESVPERRRVTVKPAASVRRLSFSSKSPGSEGVGVAAFENSASSESGGDATPGEGASSSSDMLATGEAAPPGPVRSDETLPLASSREGTGSGSWFRTKTLRSMSSSADEPPDFVLARSTATAGSATRAPASAIDIPTSE